MPHSEFKKQQPTRLELPNELVYRSVDEILDLPLDDNVKDKISEISAKHQGQGIKYEDESQDSLEFSVIWDELSNYIRKDIIQTAKRSGLATMKPSQMVVVLRRIASKIQSSKNPDRSFVARDLKKIISILLNQPRKTLKETIKRLLENNEDPNKYDTRYLGGWIELVTEAMGELEPKKLGTYLDWNDAVSEILDEEAVAGQLDRGVEPDWNEIEDRIRAYS